ncbi:PQQ-dependent sugar dehydrogenase [Pelovirga terrestris]|uniref:PQQ-dependent sugar dehydrogenase n=1 Tax=Pelovirga terrestris TaxID=2771352 RepID=A0A8J6QPI7_9BACT|nr:PQQ-dependent sugar dehydrogenase [Pelovirga terrestris]MBD1400391.1 PQQ-dependent sugar dehydrogenase [Pelovirga terrestris]
MTNCKIFSFCTLAVSLAFLLLISSPFSAAAQVVTTSSEQIRIVEITRGLEHPWGMAFLPDGRILVTERPGRLRLVENGQLLPQPVSGLPNIVAQGQSGLLDVALHPRFADNQLIYIAYTSTRSRGISTDVARGTFIGNQLKEVEVLFRGNKGTSTGRHFGSRLVFDGKGFLYISLGDHGQKERAQDTDDHAGSVIRIHDDGRIPAGNPYQQQPDWLPELFSIGNRNIQGAALHPLSGELWAHEHGPQGGDEINIIRSGHNYGWPVITYGVNYGIGTRIGIGTHKEGMEQPLYYWDPSIAPAGMTFYTGDQFPGWRGNLLVGALRGQMLVRLTLEGEEIVAEERLLQNRVGRIRDVRQGPDGFIYLLTDARNGALLRLEPATP